MCGFWIDGSQISTLTSGTAGRAGAFCATATVDGVYRGAVAHPATTTTTTATAIPRFIIPSIKGGHVRAVSEKGQTMPVLTLGYFVQISEQLSPNSS